MIRTIVSISLAAALIAVTPAAVAAGPADASGQGAATAPVGTADKAADAPGDAGADGAFYVGDPVSEAALVLAEERRLIDVDIVSKGTMFPDLDTSLPYRVAGEPMSTLVLPARDTPYTQADLLRLAPLTFVLLPDGSYLLSEHVAVMKDAVLDLKSPTGFTLRLASQESGFATVVAIGGDILIEGTPAAPAKVTSWDTVNGEPDLNTEDGRAYIRVMGGYASLVEAEFSNLGFWSGNTGGIALTGTDAPYVPPAPAETEERLVPEVHVEGTDAAEEPVVLDATTAQVTDLDFTYGAGLYGDTVTARLSGLIVTGNAFGIFVSNADNVELTNSIVSGSLVDGVVFHRDVVGGRIVGVESFDNAQDGVRVSRGSSGIIVDAVTAYQNGRNGITIDATPLASGPSATGLSTTIYGGHTVMNSTVRANAKYGIAVYGGDGIVVRRNTVTGSPTGILVADGATAVVVDTNAITASPDQAIALRDGVTAEVTGNTIRGSIIAIYSRDSAATITGNSIAEVTSHGVTMVGEAAGSTVGANTISGSGNTPIDTFRAVGVSVLDTNVTGDWVYVNWTERLIRTLTKPLTMMWIILGMLLIFTAFRGLHHRRHGHASPYRDRTPLTGLTRGIVDPSTVEGVVMPYDAARLAAAARAESGRGSIEDLPRRAKPVGV